MKGNLEREREQNTTHNTQHRHKGMLRILSIRALNQRLPFSPLTSLHTQTRPNLNLHLLAPPMAASPNHLPSFSTASPSPPSPSPAKRVGTHNGSFHCDEALGCFMIRLSDKFSGAEIVRTRDPQVTERERDSRFDFVFISSILCLFGY